MDVLCHYANWCRLHDTNYLRRSLGCKWRAVFVVSLVLCWLSLAEKYFLFAFSNLHLSSAVWEKAFNWPILGSDDDYDAGRLVFLLSIQLDSLGSQHWNHPARQPFSHQANERLRVLLMHVINTIISFILPFPFILISFENRKREWRLLALPPFERTLFHEFSMILAPNIQIKQRSCSPPLNQKK